MTKEELADMIYKGMKNTSISAGPEAWHYDKNNLTSVSLTIPAELVTLAREVADILEIGLDEVLNRFLQDLIFSAVRNISIKVLSKELLKFKDNPSTMVN